jgi:hypothetical protein
MKDCTGHRDDASGQPAQNSAPSRTNTSTPHAPGSPRVRAAPGRCARRGIVAAASRRGPDLEWEMRTRGATAASSSSSWHGTPFRHASWHCLRTRDRPGQA